MPTLKRLLSLLLLFSYSFTILNVAVVYAVIETEREVDVSVEIIAPPGGGGGGGGGAPAIASPTPGGPGPIPTPTPFPGPVSDDTSFPAPPPAPEAELPASEVVNLPDRITSVPFSVMIDTTGEWDLLQLFYSKDGGAYTLYTDVLHPGGFFDTNLISGIFLPDGDYEFYSIAFGGGGEVEVAPLVADAFTSIDTRSFLLPDIELVSPKTGEVLTGQTDERTVFLHFLTPGSESLKNLRVSGSLVDTAYTFQDYPKNFFLFQEYIPISWSGSYGDKTVILDGSDGSGQSGQVVLNIEYIFNIESPNTEEDGLTDAEKFGIGDDPLNTDSDPDGICAYKYESIGLTGIEDTDGDGLSNAMDCRYFTNPFNEDTDGDGYSDGEEVLLYQSDPLDPLDPGFLENQTKITNLKFGLTVTDSKPSVQGFAIGSKNVIIYAFDRDGKRIELARVETDDAGRFIAIPALELSEGYYDIQAVSYENDWETVVAPSLKIRIIVDFSLKIPPPIVYAISSFTFPQPLGNQAAVNSFVAHTPIKISSPQPTVSGNSLYLSNVVAIFKSLITSASLIADIESGDFEITAPEPLDYGLHTLVLYATTPDGIRSQELVIPFEVVPDLDSLMPFGWIYIIIIASMIAWIIAEKRKDLRSVSKRKNPFARLKSLHRYLKQK